MKTKLFVPHIDKTGGTSLNSVLFKTLAANDWTVHTNIPSSAYMALNMGNDILPLLKTTDNLPEKLARIGMHHAYQPEIMNDEWFKFVVIREPYSRFVSSFNFYIYEIWRDHKSLFNMTIEQYVDVIKFKNLGYRERITNLLDPNEEYNLPQDAIINAAEFIRTKFPWSLLMSSRGYISSTTSLNAETEGNIFTNQSILDIFDVVIDLSRFDEVEDMMLTNIGVKIPMDVQLNVSKNNATIIPNVTPLKVTDLTGEQKELIQTIPAFQQEAELWEMYKDSRHCQ